MLAVIERSLGKHKFRLILLMVMVSSSSSLFLSLSLIPLIFNLLVYRVPLSPFSPPPPRLQRQYYTTRIINIAAKLFATFVPNSSQQVRPSEYRGF